MTIVDLTELEVIEHSTLQSAAVAGGIVCGFGCDGLLCGLWCGR